MTNPAPASNSRMLAKLRGNFQEFKRQQQIFNQVVPQLTEVFVALIPLPNQSSLSTPTTNQTEPSTVIKWLSPEEANVLKRLKDAAVDQYGGLKNVEAFVQFLGATSTTLMEHWDSIPSEMQQQLVALTQPMLDLIAGARPSVTPNVPIESTSVTTQTPFLPGRRLSSLKTTWVIIREPHKILKHLNQLFVALLKLTRTVQRLNDRDIKMAEFRRKLAACPNWDREAQIKRNQGAIAWIQARIEKDEQMTEQEQIEASLESERIRQIIDAHRDPGNKLFSDD